MVNFDKELTCIRVVTVVGDESQVYVILSESVGDLDTSIVQTSSGRRFGHSVSDVVSRCVWVCGLQV